MSEQKNFVCYKKQTVFEKAGKEVADAAYAYAKGYTAFLDAAKTEREATDECVGLAKAAGYRE